MKNALLVLLCLLFSGLTAAAEEPVLNADEVAAKRDRVIDLKARAKLLRQGADAAQKLESAECRKSLLVNNCLSGARDRRLEKIEQARALEMDVAALEKEIRRFELIERRNERARRQEARSQSATVSVDGVPSATVLPADNSSQAAGGGK